MRVQSLRVVLSATIAAALSLISAAVAFAGDVSGPLPK